MLLEIMYKDKKIKQICTSLKSAKKFFGGQNLIAINLLARINQMQNADTLKDFLNATAYHFHPLKGNLQGYFALDIKSRKDKWRLILIPLNTEKKPFDPCHIDKIAPIVQIIKIMEVSAHYE